MQIEAQVSSPFERWALRPAGSVHGFLMGPAGRCPAAALLPAKLGGCIRHPCIPCLLL